MAPRKKTGRATAEAAYAHLLADNTALVGDVGEAWDAYLAKLDDAATARQHYERARLAAVKGGAITHDQLEQLGYKKTSKLPATPPRTTAEPTAKNGAAQPNTRLNGAPSTPVLNGAAPRIPMEQP